MGISREQLFEEVWAEPMTTVAKRYGVSSNYLARICERLDVPRPERGYWAQRAVGIEFEPTILPAAEPGSDLEWVRDGSGPKRQPMTPQTRKAALARRKGDLHRLLGGARAHFDHARETRDETYVRPFKQTLVDVLVSKDQLERALKVANALFWTLEDHGHTVKLVPSGTDCHRTPPELKENGPDRTDYYSSGFGRWKPSHVTACFVGELAFGLTVFETSEEVEVRYDSTRHEFVRVRTPIGAAKKKPVSQVAGYDGWNTKKWLPTGRLGVHVYCPQPGIAWERYWREAQGSELPSLFPAVIKEVESAPPALATLIEKKRQDDEKRRLEWEEQQRKWAEKEAQRRRQELEQAREKALLEAIKGWRLARDVRMYVNDIKTLVTDAGMRLTEDGTPDQELNWALAYADRVDPLSAWRAEIEKAKSEPAKEACSDCGKLHQAAESTAPKAVPSPSNTKQENR